MPYNAATTAIAVNASIQASHARDTACQSLEFSFNAQTANTAQKLEYAECIQRLYPQEMSPDLIIAVKILIMSAIIGAVIGFFVDNWDTEGRILNAFVGFLFTPVLLVMGYFLYKMVTKPVFQQLVGCWFRVAGLNGAMVGIWHFWAHHAVKRLKSFVQHRRISKCIANTFGNFGVL